MDQAIAKIRELMWHPVPRPVPGEIEKHARNPVALHNILTGLLVLGVILFFSYAQKFEYHFGFPLLIQLTIFVTALGLTGWGIYSLRNTRKILTWGQLYEGKVERVKSLPVRKRRRGESFYLVIVKFRDEYSRERTASDVVDQLSLKYFCDARDEGKNVELIFTPRVRRNVLLPEKIAARARSA